VKERPTEDRRKGDEERKNFAARRGAIPSRRARMIAGNPERDSPGKTASPLDDARCAAASQHFDPIGILLVAKLQAAQEQKRGQDEVARADARIEREPRLDGLVEGDPDDAGGDRGGEGQSDIGGDPTTTAPAHGSVGAKQGRHDRGDSRSAGRRGRRPASRGGAAGRTPARVRGSRRGAARRSRCPSCSRGGTRFAPWSSPRKIDWRKLHGGGSHPRVAARRAPRLHPSRRGFRPERPPSSPSLRTAARAPAGCSRPGQPHRRSEEAARIPSAHGHPPAPAAPRSGHLFHHPNLISSGQFDADLGGGHDGGQVRPGGALTGAPPSR